MKTLSQLAAGLLAVFGLTAGAEAAEKPKLVVVVSVDQLCQDYLIRFSDNFADKGLFRRVQTDGARYANCHHRHALTVTAPGHAVQLTGAYPNTHGIIGNEGYNRELKVKSYCVVDPSTKVVGIDSKNGMSPRALKVETTGDQMKLASRQSKVFGVAIKDRASILMAGHSADAAFWMEKNFWVTTEYYRADLPGYLQVSNQRKAIEEYRGKVWELLLPKEKYHNNGPDQNDWENPPKGFSSAFPHSLYKVGEGEAKEFGDQVLGSPFGNDATLKAARAVLLGEELGRDAIPDLLCLNLSSNDYVGHAYGPQSLEVEDITYRTDIALGDFARFLDEHVGVGQWTLLLTSDHGVAPIVQVAQKLKLPAIRNPLPVETVKTEIEKLLRETFSIPAVAPAVVEYVEDYSLFLNREHPALQGDKLVLARRIVRDWIGKQRHVVAVKTRDDLLYGDGDELHAAMRRGYYQQLSGDVLWAFAPYCVPGNSKRGTAHGSPWSYDTHVPLLLLGSGVRAGQFERPVSPACIASTVARLVGVKSPAANVELPLIEALAE